MKPLKGCNAFGGFSFASPSIGQRLATRVDGSLYYVHSDLLGSTVALSDAAGGEVGRVQYDPYGEVITSTLPADLTEQLLSSQGLDSRLGLVYHGDGRRYPSASSGQATRPSLTPCNRTRSAASPNCRRR